MKINNNMSAVVANNRLLANENSLAASMEKLSSGLKINHAKDNPSGIAISKKMKAQIEGLDKASQNASDGVSVAQTADAALGEVTSLLQRIRELAVQAANGTMSDSDKESCQVEIDSLKDEVDRISTSTEFNTKSLLDGSLDARVYGDNVSRAQASSLTPAGTYKFTVTQSATQAISTSGDPLTGSDEVPAGAAGTVKINGYAVTISEGMTKDEVYEALRDGAEKGEATISDASDNLTFTSTKYGSDASILVEVSNSDLETFLGFTSMTEANVGTDAKITLDKTADSDFGSQATYALDGNKVTITDSDGFEISCLLDSKYVGDISLEVTDVGPMDVQIGSNEGQIMTIRIPSCSTESLYIDDLDVTTVNGAMNALDALDYAMDRVSSARSSLGAFQNRLETSVDSLDETSENMTSALSRIEDVDMAEEMVNYTSYNVIAQAATSALSQANELPQLAIQLLQ